jgi:hypothetical protein
MSSTGSGFFQLGSLWLNIDHIVVVRKPLEADISRGVASTSLAVIETDDARLFAVDITVDEVMDLITRAAGWNEHELPPLSFRIPAEPVGDEDELRNLG